MSKAKVPVTAAGIALIGVAGGLAAANRKRNGSTLLPGGKGPNLPQLNLKQRIPDLNIKERIKDIDLPSIDGSTIDWVEGKAKEFGDAGYKVAELASDARQVQKAVSDE